MPYTWADFDRDYIKEHFPSCHRRNGGKSYNRSHRKRDEKCWSRCRRRNAWQACPWSRSDDIWSS